MTKQIPPEQCPEPFWHETHRYCPACSWIEPGPIERTVKLSDEEWRRLLALLDPLDFDKPEAGALADAIRKQVRDVA